MTTTKLYFPLESRKGKCILNLYCLYICILVLTSFFVYYFSSWYGEKGRFSQNYIYVNISKDQIRAQTYSRFTYVSQFKETYDHSLVRNVTNTEIQNDRVISCYYNVPSNFTDPLQLQPQSIHPHLCTHINVAFASIANKTILLSKELKQTVVEVVKLKKANPNLKVLLSIGGAGDDSGFSDMVIDHASRKIFIKSIKSFLTNYGADGVDLDWEFPQVNNYPHRRERQHFSQLLREIRKEYEREKHDYLLTVAVAAPEIIVDIAYDVGEINLYTDYVNIMTYDFHSYSRYTPFTGLNSPLYPERDDNTFMGLMNINSTVSMYSSKGLDLNKIVVGVPTYGHTFTLVNAFNTKIGSPASGFGKLGSMGFINYPDICQFMQKYGKEVILEFDEVARVPYIHRAYEWISYENQISVMEKAKYVKNNGLRGAMIYSLNADDYLGQCQFQDDKFPLSNSIRSTLINEKQ